MTLLSGNTFGSTLWSDGKLAAPMWPEQPRFVRCPHCQFLFWFHKARRVYSWWPVTRRQIRAIRWVSWPQKDDFLAALKLGFAKDTESEKYLRIQAWRAANDALRSDAGAEVEAVIDGAMVANLKALCLLLDVDLPDDRILKAEIQRELGKFEAAQQILNIPFAEEYQDIVAWLQSLIAQGARRVARIPEPVSD